MDAFEVDFLLEVKVARSLSCGWWEAKQGFVFVSIAKGGRGPFFWIGMS